MDALLDWPFWLVALGAIVLMRAPLFASAMRRWGLLNVGALAAVFGWRAAGAALVVGGATWALLRVRRGGISALVGALLLFALHKLHLEGRLGAWGAAPLDLLARLAWSYAFLRLWDAVRAVGTGARLLDPLALCGYLFPFHMLVAGPIGAYREHLAADAREPDDLGFGALVGGLDVITTGLFYKLVLAEALRMFAFGVNEPLRTSSLFDSALLFVYLFFDFAGVSLIALGLGRLLGVPTPVNFERPFLATSLTDFWQRWHASLGAWVRAHLFLPLQVRLVRAWGVRRAYAAGLLVLVLAFGCVGAWHRLDARFLLWGLGMGSALALEKLVRDRLLRREWARAASWGRAWQFVGPVYVFAVLTLSLHPLWEILL